MAGLRRPMKHNFQRPNSFNLFLSYRLCSATPSTCATCDSGAGGSCGSWCRRLKVLVVHRQPVENASHPELQQRLLRTVVHRPLCGAVGLVGVHRSAQTLLRANGRRAASGAEVARPRTTHQAQWFPGFCHWRPSPPTTTMSTITILLAPAVLVGRVANFLQPLYKQAERGLAESGCEQTSLIRSRAIAGHHPAPVLRQHPFHPASEERPPSEGRGGKNSLEEWLDCAALVMLLGNLRHHPLHIDRDAEGARRGWGSRSRRTAPARHARATRAT
mmetsp:Transcript_22006/g.60278  ORF Transcript_22006/g.60278 Transcript_22006/m.60278 type:complete len:274 (-) Transcript_22006:2130-2951(-)